MFKKKKILATLLITCLMLTSNPIGQTFAHGAGAETDRISGQDRYQTAVAVSQKGWIKSDYAVLARGEEFADALCAGPLAAKYGGPILLTDPSKLNTDTLKELQRLGVKHLFMIGSLNALSQKVEDTLLNSGITTIERIYGENRYETSVKIAQKVGNKGKAVLATGNDFPDALSISGIASQLAMPILLTEKDRLPVAVQDYLNANTVTQTYIVGGIGVISNEVAAHVPSSLRLAGLDRYATNVAILRNFVADQNMDTIYVTTGTKFADALTGAVLAAKNTVPLVLSNQQLPKVTSDYLKTVLEEESKVVGLGGETVVSSTVLESIRALTHPNPSPIETMDVAVYYLKNVHDYMILVREVHLLEKNAGVARAGLNELITGTPLTQGAYRVLPADTKILGITIENGLATIDFSQEVLNANVGAGREVLGIASIVNTLTEFPTIQKVAFTVEGKAENAMDWWGHVGLYDQPFFRDLSAVYEPIIWVDSPVAEQTIQSGFRIKGNAMVFEATVSFRLRDSHGNILAEGWTTAESGAPERGNFEATLNFTPSVAGSGQLEVFEASAKDGSDQNLVIIPVRW